MIVAVSLNLAQIQNMFLRYKPPTINQHASLSDGSKRIRASVLDSANLFHSGGNWDLGIGSRTVTVGSSDPETRRPILLE